MMNIHGRLPARAFFDRMKVEGLERSERWFTQRERITHTDLFVGDRTLIAVVASSGRDTALRRGNAFIKINPDGRDFYQLRVMDPKDHKILLREKGVYREEAIAVLKAQNVPPFWAWFHPLCGTVSLYHKDQRIIPDSEPFAVLHNPNRSFASQILSHGVVHLFP